MANFLLRTATLLRGISILGLYYLEWVGLIVTLVAIGYELPQILHSIYVVWIAPALRRGVNFTDMGQWAVVSGASDGIGKAYAEELARLGVNIVLISRSKAKLDTVANEIEKAFGVRTKTIAVDFTEGVTVYDEIERELEGLEIGTLVNNVGIWYPYVDHFTDLPNARKHSQDMIFCNVVPVTFMTHLVLPQMCERRRGVIINVGSLNSTLPGAFVSMYSATKVFVERFSESLALEYQKFGVIVQVVLPAYVASKMSRVATPSFFTPSPTDYVQKALKTVGVESRTAAYIPHRLAVRGCEWGFKFFPIIACNLFYQRAAAMRQISKRKREAENIRQQMPLEC